MLKVSLLRGLEVDRKPSVTSAVALYQMESNDDNRAEWTPLESASVPRPGLLSNPRSKLETEPNLSMTTHTVQHPPPINRVNGLHDISNKSMNMTMRATLYSLFSIQNSGVPNSSRTPTLAKAKHRLRHPRIHPFLDVGLQNDVTSYSLSNLHMTEKTV